MKKLMSSKRGFIASNAVWCMAVSLIAAYFTGNPNWAWNIPFCLLGGGLIGWAGWSIGEVLRLRRQRKQAGAR